MVSLFMHLVFFVVLAVTASGCKTNKYYTFGDTVISTTTVVVPITVPAPTPCPRHHRHGHDCR